MPRALSLVAILALLTACDRPGNPAKIRELAGRALRGTLTYPRSTIVSLSAGDEAAELVMTSPDSVALVAGWYRQALPLNGWKLKRDTRDHSGSVTIYAEQGDRPLWLTVRPNAGGVGTTYTLIGAVLEGDSAKAPSSPR
jgi:hypothetical protein